MLIPQCTLVLLLATLQPMFRPLTSPLIDEASFASPYEEDDLEPCPSPAIDLCHRHSWFHPPIAESDNTAGYRASVESAYEPWYRADNVFRLEGAAQSPSDEVSDWYAFLHRPWPNEPILDDDSTERDDSIDREMVTALPNKDQIASRLANLIKLHRFHSVQGGDPASSETDLTYDDLFSDTIDEIEASMIWGPDDLVTELNPPHAVNDDATAGNDALWNAWLSRIRSYAWTDQAGEWLEEQGAVQALDRATKWITAQVQAINLPNEVREPQVNEQVEEPSEKEHALSQTERLAERLDISELRTLIGVSSVLHRAADSLDQIASSLRGSAIKELASRGDSFPARPPGAKTSRE